MLCTLEINIFASEPNLHSSQMTTLMFLLNTTYHLRFLFIIFVECAVGYCEPTVVEGPASCYACPGNT